MGQTPGQEGESTETVKIITAGDKKFRKMVKNSVEKAEALGHKIKPIDLGGLGFGTKHDVDPDSLTIWRGYIAKITHKPGLVERFLEDEFTVWIDGDAFLIGKIDGVVSGDYDIGVTIRRANESTAHPMAIFPANAGVMFFNPTKETRKFIKKWNKRTYELPSKSDQHALNLFLKESEDYRGRGKYGYDMECQGATIRLFNSEVYNHYYFDDTLEDAKILHFKGKHRNKYWDYANRYSDN